jgi:hypothetical protein
MDLIYVSLKAKSGFCIENLQKRSYPYAKHQSSFILLVLMNLCRLHQKVSLQMAYVLSGLN